MDWTIKAAKKKNEQPAGGSRSIVESLNKFNNIDTVFQSKVNSKIIDSLSWLNEFKELQPIILSPERTQAIKDQTKIDESNNETPKRSFREDGFKVTPHSLKQLKISNESNKDLTIKSSVNKTSPWSPFKVDQTLKNNITSPKQNGKEINNSADLHKSNDIIDDKNETTSKFTTISTNSLNSVSSITTTNTSKVHINKSPNLTLNRMKRRSNMFVPLPKKDPLIVQDAIKFNQNHTFSGTTLRVNKQTNLSPKLEINNKSINSRLTRKTQSPTLNKNVFDRLSSTSTKSFDKKVTTKSTIGRKFTPSSIDLSGSPMKRNSSRRTSSVFRKQHLLQNPADVQVRETLKNIFSTDTNSNIPEVIPKKSPKPLTDKRLDISTRRSLIPILNKRKTLDIKDKRNSMNEHESSNVIDVDKNLSVIGEEKSSKINSTLLGATSNEQTTEQNKDKNKESNDHRLTKFQLLRSEEFGKRDLKQKLNKRLSEVMKTQQESAKHKSQQTKKSTYELDSRNRNNNFSDFKSFGSTRQVNNTRKSNNFNLSQTSGIEELSTRKSQNVIDTRNILNALNTGDHRIKIGESTRTSLNDVKSDGNDTLPEIYSDSDQENITTLTDWARAPYLQEQLRLQQNWDYRKIFGPIAPLHTDEIFQKSRLDKFKTKSSLNKK